ncbi:MAG: dihydrodipicolinate synthase family protein [Acidobacteria bacterium]|nr:dihydrodipicolinate synthase family protein [Acidobacteriota bacterium]
MSYTLKTGLNIPTITVLDDAGRVIADEQRRVFRHVVQNGYGTEMIFGVGTTGEWNRLANIERQRIIEIEVDEVRQINAELTAANPSSASAVEAWVGVNGSTRQEILANLDAALQLGADTAVIAPLAIEDLAESDIVRFFQRDITDLLEASRRPMPVFLYDNADIAAAGQPPHIRTHIVKHLSRLPWVRGLKVSAPRHVLGNYTKAALHYKLPGEFGIYIGNAMLIFEMYRPSHGLLGRLREGWRDFQLHNAPPIGVVSGPANCLPREWHKAWRVCWTGDEELTDRYLGICQQFERICAFVENGQPVKKTIACVKYALELDGVISSSLVGKGTAPLNHEQKQIFGDRYRALQEEIRQTTPALWNTSQQARRPERISQPDSR